MLNEQQARAQIEEILRWEDANRHITPVFKVAGLWLSAHNPDSPTGWRSIERVAADGDGAGILLNVTLAGHLAQNLEGYTAQLDIHFGEGLVVRRFTGEVIDHGEEEADTVLLCGTGGYWLDKIKFMERTPFIGQTPEWVIRYCMGKCPYNQSLIEVERIRLPEYTRTDDEANTAFPPWAAVGEPLIDLAAQEDIVYRDTSHNGSSTTHKVLTGSPEWDFEVQSNRLGKTPIADTDEGPFHSVIVYREDEVGDTIELAQVFVPGSKAPANSVLWIQIEDISTNQEANALQIAHDAAERQAGYRRELTWDERVNHPYLDRGSWVTILERGWDDGGEFAKHWLGELVSIDDNWSGEERLQAYTAEAVLVREERVAVPTPPPAGTTRVVRQRLVRYGIDGQPEIEDQAWVTMVDAYNYEIDVAELQAAGLSITVDDERNEWTIDTVIGGSPA